MTKICYLSPLSIHSYRWIEAFYGRGYDISLITDRITWAAPEIHFISVYKLLGLDKTNLLWRSIPNMAKIALILKHISPDFVHLHCQHYYIPPIIVKGLPLILTSWGHEILELPHSGIFNKSLAKFVALKASSITVDGECLKKIWVSLGVPKTKIEVIPFGVDTDFFNPNIDGQLVRQQLQIEKEDMVVISTRPFYNNNHYNLQCLIKAIPSVLKNHENIKFIIKGSGPLEKYLKKLTEKLGVAQQVRFIGLVPHRKVAQLLSAADIYVSTGLVDSTSVSLLEAMACQLAPVVTDISGNIEWIKDGVNGLLYPPKNNSMLAEKIIHMVENPRLRRAFGRKCVRIIEKRAAWESCVLRMEAIYEKLAKR
jgi:glycosyltransferase involved in cell wall biosynthesis